MKILIGADQYPEYINGAANFTDRLARGLAARGHQITVIWPSADGAPTAYREAGMDVHRLRSFRLPRSNGLRISAPDTSRRHISAILAAAQPDVVHIQSHILVGRQLARAAHQGSYPLVATNHFMPENVLGHVPLLNRSNTAVSRWAWHDLAAVFGQADLVTAPTQRAVHLLSTAAGLTADVVSCGIDPSRFGRPEPTGTSTSTSTRDLIPTVLFVGRLETEKRVDELLRAFAALPASVPARLQIVGTGTQAHQLQTLASNLGLGDRVRFAGPVGDADLVVAYRSADIFCMPGTAELQSLATLEAMSAALPVIAADAMALPHLVTPGHNGYLFTPGNIDQLANHLTTLLGQPERRREMGQDSQRMAEQHSLEHTLTAFESRYEQLCRHELTRPSARPGREAARQRHVTSASA